MCIDEKVSPLVSVIMPAYNAERFIEEAINSVINQTLKDWELIVIDDCSTDSTFELAKKVSSGDSRICVIQNEMNSGVAKTRNKGIASAIGQYIAFLDSDDVWYPQKLELQLKKMKDENAPFSYCSYEIIGIDGNKARGDYIVPEVAQYKDILKENYVQCSAMLIRADIVKEIGFNTEFFHEDYILGLDILRRIDKAVGCSEILLSWRYLENSRSFNKKRSAINRWKIYRNYLQLPLLKTMWLFFNYMVAGFKKYFRTPSRC